MQRRVILLSYPNRVNTNTVGVIRGLRPLRKGGDSKTSSLEVFLELEKVKLKNDWQKLMDETKTYNHFYDTFAIGELFKESYGWSFKLYAPRGMSFDELNRLKPIIEDRFKCKFIWEEASDRWVRCMMIHDNAINSDKDSFRFVKLRPYEVYPALKVLGNSMQFNTYTKGQTR